MPWDWDIVGHASKAYGFLLYLNIFFVDEISDSLINDSINFAQVLLFIQLYVRERGGHGDADAKR